MTGPQAIVSGALSGVLLFIVLVVAVFAAGATFGQRCSAAGHSAADHERCIMRLADGGPVYVENSTK